MSLRVERYRLCAEPRCAEVVATPARYCDEHARQHGWEAWRRTPNGLARATGYGSRWRRLRDERLRVHPVCEYCRRAPATEVHHTGHELPTDARFYDYDRLRACCSSCHRRRSHERERTT
jgi:5-methylcytosine-specific restriction enzyme A